MPSLWVPAAIIIPSVSTSVFPPVFVVGNPTVMHGLFKFIQE
jgi:hypothetical protein